MTYEKLKKIIFNSHIKVAIIGIVILALGGLIMLYPLVNAKSNNIVALIFGGVFAALGALALRNAIPAMLQAKSDKHPMLKAIKSGEKDYLFWVYIKQIHTTVGEDVKVGTASNVIYFSKDCKGKGVELALGKNDSAEDLLVYFQEHFEIPYVGYGEEAKNAVNNHFGNSGWQKVQ